VKPLAFNLKDARKISGDKNSSTFMLKGGHQIRVAHAPLPALQRKQIEKLAVHMDVGGSAGGETTEESGDADHSGQVLTQGGYYITPEDKSSGFIPAVTSAVGKAMDFVNGTDSPEVVPAPDRTAAASSDLPNMGQPVGQSANPSSQIPTSPAADVAGLYQQGKKGISEEADYEKNLAAANATNEQSDLDARQDLLQGVKTNAQQFQDEQRKFMDDYANNKIDPKHYIENMDSDKKAATAIGLFLGGWGSAFTKQGNPALDFLNKQIDRDIEAQQSRIGQQKTLLEANQNLYHDSVLASNATRMQMNDIYAHKIQLEAAKLGTPLAQANKDKALAKFGLENAQLLQQNATRAAVMHSLVQGGQGIDPIDLGNIGLMKPEEAQKEKSSIDAQKTAIQATKSLFTELNKEQTAGNLANPQSYARVNAIKAELVNAVMNASASKRLTHESIAAEIDPLLTKTIHSPETAQTQMNGLLDIIGRHADPTPVTSKYAPKAVPAYPYQQQAQTPQYKVGDILYVKGQGKVQITDPQGNYRPVK
jgi:hypothetical protein